VPRRQEEAAPVSHAVESSRAISGGKGIEKRIGRKGLEIIEEMARDGHPDVSIAKALRMHRETFRMCRRRQGEVDEALARGRAALESELAHLLLQHARKGNVVAAIFLAKARCGWREGEAPADTRPNITINLPDSQTPEDYLKMVNARWETVDDTPRLEAPDA
jgi:hypothetical protein